MDKPYLKREKFQKKKQNKHPTRKICTNQNTETIEYLTSEVTTIIIKPQKIHDNNIELEDVQDQLNALKKKMKHITTTIGHMINTHIDTKKIIDKLNNMPKPNLAMPTLHSESTYKPKEFDLVENYPNSAELFDVDSYFII